MSDPSNQLTREQSIAKALRLLAAPPYATVEFLGQEECMIDIENLLSRLSCLVGKTPLHGTAALDKVFPNIDEFNAFWLEAIREFQSRLASLSASDQCEVGDALGLHWEVYPYEFR